MTAKRIRQLVRRPAAWGVGRGVRAGTRARKVMPPEDRDLLREEFRPALKRLKLYYPGFAGTPSAGRTSRGAHR